MPGSPTSSPRITTPGQPPTGTNRPSPISHDNNRGLGVALAIVVGAFAMLFIVVTVIGALGRGASTAVATAATHGHQPASTRSTKNTDSTAISGDSACQIADSRERQAADYINHDHYQKTYDTAVSGLHYVSLCDDDDDNLENRAYLLSFKAIAEHNLSSGDSRTDLNEANTLLVECQTHPGFYGTNVGAQCESQEQYNIQDQTNWEMEQYNQ